MCGPSRQCPVSLWSRKERLMDGTDASSLRNGYSDAYSRGPPHTHIGSSDSESFDPLTPVVQVCIDARMVRTHVLFPGFVPLLLLLVITEEIYQECILCQRGRCIIFQFSVFEFLPLPFSLSLSPFFFPLSVVL